MILASASGCGFFRRLAGNDTISLEKADVRSMAVDLRKEQKTICPREPVQMAVFAEIVFSRPGIGKLLFTSVLNRNYPVVMGATVVTTTLLVAGALIVDLINALLDPRSRERL